MLLSALILAASVQAADPKTSEADAWQQALDQKRPCEATAKEDYPWYDKAHLLLSDSVCQRALWFDSFLSAGAQLTDKQASSLLWLSLQPRWNEREDSTLKPVLRAVIDLPNTKKRLKLVIEGQDDAQLNHNADDSTSLDNKRSSAALRYSVFDHRNWDLDLDLGIRLNGGPFTRARAKYHHAFNETTVGTLTQELVLELKELWHETSRFTLQHFSDDTIYRLVSQGKYGQESDGMEWRLWLSRTDQLSKRGALSCFAAVEGATQDPRLKAQSEIYRLGFNYRRTMWRPWFFFELEPQLTFPRKFNYKETWQMTLKFEFQFGKSRKRGFYH